MKRAAAIAPLTMLVAMSGLLPVAPPAAADVGVVGVNPPAARPGQRIVLRVGCGYCHRPTRFPISLVPVAQAPRPHPCHEDGLCAPEVATPPRKHPFMFLGRTRGGKVLLPSADPPGSESQLRFRTPNVQPGRYAFVIFTPCADCHRGARGLLFAETTRKLLHVEPRDAPVRHGESDDAPALRIAAPTGIAALVIAAVLLMR